MSDSLDIINRRYIGSKAKLSDWIFSIIDENTEGVKTFCDIFAGTAVIAQNAILKFDKVIINDFLYSNNVIYNGFFAKGRWSKTKIKNILKEYESLDDRTIPDNYFSNNYGDKFFEKKLAKKIGYIRQDIEDRRDSLTKKEYYILLTTLIYNIDRYANTVGHFEAYIKKPIPNQDFHIKGINAQSYDNVVIHQLDANNLAKILEADLVYIDPPYNSRQYSRFYHVYETLVKWDFPELFGSALKPVPENMSDYCTTKAVDAFADLIQSLRSKYIVVSYNNTYNSKSSSSKNKLQLNEILDILNKKGETRVFTHKHRFFDAGKTDFDNHKEFIFLTTVHE